MANQRKSAVKTSKISKASAKAVAKVVIAKAKVAPKAKVVATKKVATKPLVKAVTKAVIKPAKTVAKPSKVTVKTVTKSSKVAVKVPKKAVAKTAAVTVKKVEKSKKKAPISVSKPEQVQVKPYAVLQNEEYMNETQQLHFKELLRTWRAALTTKIDTAVSHLKDEPKHFADLNDRATQEEEFSLELKARDREAESVIKIDEALKRLHEGDYGYCEECGIEIGIRRLEARPTATLCIDCKTLAEMRERQSGGV